KINRIVVSTYQSITGTGVKAVRQLENESKGIEGDAAYPYQIHKNALPHCDVFEEAGYTKEELKLVRETHKILNDPTIGVTATAVRIPVVGGHSEAVNLEFDTNYDIEDIRKILFSTDGVVVQDDIEKNQYPMPFFAEGKDEVFVGRIRRDLSRENALNMWIVADNLRKGAATNTIQIAEYLVTNKLIKNNVLA
ncbi:MAG TPA: aspartate-semialdehyde dehydrogenase, partial [Tenacibaculum sp.]|nr:aspartate-semialdehyde dehydrogenase [Tenacibaculum sp.]